MNKYINAFDYLNIYLIILLFLYFLIRPFCLFNCGRWNFVGGFSYLIIAFHKSLKLFNSQVGPQDDQ